MLKSNYISMASNVLKKRGFTENSVSNSTANTTEHAANEYATQNDLFGPISRALLVDPVRIRDDEPPRAYERAQITEWINSGGGTNPMDSKKLVTVADLEPAHDKQKEIREFVKKYPDAQIVKEWLQEQPTWYTKFIKKVRTAPSVQEMSRQCNNCCSSIGDRGSAAIALGACGGLAGCTCGFPAEGAKCGAACGACIGKKGCIGENNTYCDVLLETCGMCGECIQRQNYVRDGGRRRKTRKRKQKKRRKTRKLKRKRKRTIKKKRRRGRKSRKRRS